MRWKPKPSARLVSLTLALCLWGAPELVLAQAQTPAAAPPSSTQDSPQLPDAPSARATTQSSNSQQQTQDQQKPPQPAQAPAGAAGAEAGPTAGGAGSTPAGMAIAPAKQHQVRSFLIKLGAIAGGAIAIGTVYALSRSSPSRPPGAK